MCSISQGCSYQIGNSFLSEIHKVRHTQLLLKTSHGKASCLKVAHLVFNQRYEIFRNIAQRIRTACQAAAIDEDGKGIFNTS